MNKVFVLHRNLMYEFGEVVGVFLTLESGVAAAQKMIEANPGGDFELSEWSKGSDDAVLSERPGDAVWSSYEQNRAASSEPESCQIGLHSWTIVWGLDGKRDGYMCSDCGEHKQ